MVQYDKVGMNVNTRETFLDDGVRNKLSEDEIGKMENLYVILVMETITEKINKKKIDEIFENKENIKRVNHGKKVNGKYIVKMESYNIPFELISDNLPAGYLEYKDELESDKRKSKCHLVALQLVLLLENSIILTGLIKKGEYSYLHSVVEIIDPKTLKPIILDWTRNLIMLKEDYIKIFEFNILSEISSSKVQDDMQLFSMFGIENISSKAYLIFREEMLKELNKRLYLLFNSGDEKVR